MNVLKLGIKDDLTGRKFGRLTAIEPSKRRGRSWLWKCKCDCGNTTFNLGAKLKSGLNKSCGCYKAENVRPKYGKNHKSWTGCGGISGTHWINILSSARIRKVPVKLSIEDAWRVYEEQNGICALSGVKLSFGEPNIPIKYQTRTASLDRINSDKPYEVGNVQWIHKDINYMKCWFDQKDFLNWCNLIVNFSKHKL